MKSLLPVRIPSSILAATRGLMVVWLLYAISGSSVWPSAHARPCLDDVPAFAQADTTRDTVFTCDLLAVGERIDRFVGQNGQDSVAITITLPRPFAFALRQLGADIRAEGPSDLFGIATALSGDGRRLAVGGCLHGGNGHRAGQVRVFARQNGTWQQLGANIDGEAAGDQAGRSVSLSFDGSRVAIGAPYHAGNGSRSGQVRVYAWQDSTWLQLGADIDAGMAPNDQAGMSVSLSADGRYLAVGLPGNSDHAFLSGQVRVFAWADSTWAQLGAPINGTTAQAAFGSAVSLSADGRRVAAGAPGHDGNGQGAGQVRVLTWDGHTWTPLGNVIRGDTAGDGMGAAVSLAADGNRLAVSAPYHDGNGPNAGQVRVFTRNGPTWAQVGNSITGRQSSAVAGLSIALSADGSHLAVKAQRDLTSPDLGYIQVYAKSDSGWTPVGERLIEPTQGHTYPSGPSVSLSCDGGYLAVGTPDPVSDTGYVRVYRTPQMDTVFVDRFTCDSTAVTTQTDRYVSRSGMCDSVVIRRDLLRPFAYVPLGPDLPGAQAGDLAGTSVAFSAGGDHLAVGAPAYAGQQGQVRVFAWDGQAWQQMGAILSGAMAGDRAGASVALSADGHRVVVGAPGHAGEAGRVQVFNWDGSGWSQFGSDLLGTVAGDQAGASVALSADGTRLAIGAPGHAGRGPATGRVQIFVWNGIDWAQLGSDLAGEWAGDQAGHSVALAASGSHVAVGAIGHDSGGPNVGQVRVFAWSNNGWTQLGADLEGKGSGHQVGWSVALTADGRQLAMGEPGYDRPGFGAGRVRVFSWDGIQWDPLGTDLRGEAAGDRLGWSVACSADGARLAVGAPLNAANGPGAGRTVVYVRYGQQWTPLETALPGQAPLDQAGTSVAFSADGRRLAVGAPRHDDGGPNAGQVQVYAASPPPEDTCLEVGLSSAPATVGFVATPNPFGSVLCLRLDLPFATRVTLSL